jgi:hypothetical protein
LVYEIEDKLKVGLEAYYYSPQKLNDGATGKAYWLTGFMNEKLGNTFQSSPTWKILLIHGRQSLTRFTQEQLPILFSVTSMHPLTDLF